MGSGAYGVSAAGPRLGTASGARGAVWAPAIAAVRSSAGRKAPIILPCITLRLQRHHGFSGGTVVDQLDRLEAFGLTSVLEEDQSGHGECPVAFGQGGFLHLLLHGAPFREGHLGHRGRVVGLTLTAAVAG